MIKAFTFLRFVNLPSPSLRDLGLTGGYYGWLTYLGAMLMYPGNRCLDGQSASDTKLRTLWL